MHHQNTLVNALFSFAKVWCPATPAYLFGQNGQLVKPAFTEIDIDQLTYQNVVIYKEVKHLFFCNNTCVVD